MFYVKGMDGQYLETDGKHTLKLGENNRAWLNEEKWSDTCEWTHRSPVLPGGELSFEVNVSEVECNCAAGLHLAYLNDKECRMDAYN